MFAAWSIPDFVSVVGFPLGILSLWWAWKQLRDTKSSADAARDAATRTEQHLADNHLLLLIPVLIQSSKDLERAAGANEHRSAIESITVWRETAIKVRTLVRAKNGGSDQMPINAKINTAVALIPPALEALHDAESNAYKRTRHIREGIQDATDEATTIIAERMAFVEAAA